MGNPNVHALAMRDPALAAIMGAFDGQDFGADPNGAAYAEFGDLSPFDVSRNIGADFGYGFGFGADAVAAPPVPPAPPAPGLPPVPASHPAHPIHRAMAAHHAAAGGHHPAAAHMNPAIMMAWQHHQKQMAHTEARTALLDPNANSTTKVERYDFSIANPAPLVLNTASALANMTLQPNTRIRPQRFITNAPTPQFVLLTSVLMANVNVLVGNASDAFSYGAGAQGVMLDLPTLDPANRATITGNYTGFVPPGFAIGFNFTFIVTFQGPSTIAGGM